MDGHLEALPELLPLCFEEWRHLTVATELTTYRAVRFKAPTL